MKFHCWFLMFLLQSGILEAQTALSQQTHQRRRAQMRQAREKRRRKVLHTFKGDVSQTTISIPLFESSVNPIVCLLVDANREGKLVRRPTERDIFWDEITGQYLDPSYLLDPKALPPLCKERTCNWPNRQIPSGRKERTQRVPSQGGSVEEVQWGQATERDLSWTADGKEKSKEDEGTTRLFFLKGQSENDSRM